METKTRWIAAVFVAAALSFPACDHLRSKGEVQQSEKTVKQPVSAAPVSDRYSNNAASGVSH